MLNPLILRIENLVIKYGDKPTLLDRLRHKPDTRFTAVDHVSFDVPAGGSVGIVGESGSGKSSLLRAIMGLNPIDSGNVRYQGTILNMGAYSDLRKSMQMVFQDPGTALDPMMTAGQTIAEVLRVHRIVDADAIPDRVNELLDMVAMPHDTANAYPKDLSGGQKQRIAIARALAFNPKLLVADEPTSALDVVVQAQILDVLKDLRARTGLTILTVTHNLDLVRYLCDSAVVMHNGKLVESGPVSEMFSHPRNDYTRELLAAAPKLVR